MVRTVRPVKSTRSVKVIGKESVSSNKETEGIVKENIVEIKKSKKEKTDGKRKG